jgi:UDP-glucuronate 4-epimerase
MKVLVTGSAGFIGHHLVQKLATQGHEIWGLDSINDYYDPQLKLGRLQNQGFDVSNIEYGKPLQSANCGTFVKLKLEDKTNLDAIFAEQKFEVVINLAAQAGVRFSITQPQAYVDSNIQGFLNILEACRYNNIKHLIFASSSSVYGLNKQIPFSTLQNVDHPISLYAATKKSNELMAHTYAHLFNLPVTGLRFFTVYGPWGRPDMAYFIFTNKILKGEAIDVFNNGDMKRDFTYVDDITESISRLLDKPPVAHEQAEEADFDAHQTTAPYQLFNIGNNSPVNLMDFITAIEETLGKKAEKVMKPLQPGDVHITYADVQSLIDYTGFKPTTTVRQGMKAFVDWYLEYYQIKSTNN